MNMKASETKINPIIEGTKQYVVPLFQRSYSWGVREWNALWVDLTEMMNTPDATAHFLGSIVTMPSMSVPEGVTKYLLIDGQQRMTTVFVLLILMRDIARQYNHTELADEIQNTMLTNPYKRDIDNVKLLPTQVDRSHFLSLVNGNIASGESGIIKCYQFFARKLRTTQASYDDVKTLFRIITQKLTLVSIVLEHDDNPYLVFESLNAKGKPLSQADLIRNYFFMRIHVNQQDDIYQNYWYPMFDALGDSMTEFIRHYLMRDGRFVKESDVYDTIKSRVNEKNTLQYLEDLKFNALLYNRIINPKNESDTAIQERMQRIVRLEATVIYPFLLSCYGEFAQNQMSQSTFVGILDIIENFFIRRYLCNYRREGLNQRLPMLHRQVREMFAGDYINGLPRILQSRGYPSNDELKIAVASLPLYGGGSRFESTRIILERLERSDKHHEAADLAKATIEHIMPQTLTDWWRQHLGIDSVVIHAEKLHVLGNLTLSAYNPPLSNKPYPEKKKIYAESNISLNKYFSGVEDWRASDIDNRSSAMAEIAMTIWPDICPRQEDSTQISLVTVTNTKPQEMRIHTTVIAVKHWAHVIEHTLIYLYENIESELFSDILRTYPSVIRQRLNTQYGQPFHDVFDINISMSAKGAYQFCYAVVGMCGIGTDEFEIKRVSTRV
jgi:uncharacterized protein with ParB-like and HNH nuclease domain